MENEIKNKVAQSGLITFDLEDLYQKNERLTFDLAQFYDENQIMREKKLRDDLKQFNWDIFENKFVAIFDSNQGIIPAWTNIIVTSHLCEKAKYVSFGSLQDLERELFINQLNKIDFSLYKDKKVLIKGCSKKEVPQSAYLFAVQKLKPIVKSLMYGEACSSVPIFKR